jgi:hypothetical protein
MSKFNTHTQGAENARRIAAQDRATQALAATTRKVSSLLQPFDRAATLGMRRADIEVFAAAAEYFNHIVILRSTNFHALQYIGNKAFTPKPIDCKPKTADHDVYVSGYASQVKCSGLVVDPTLLGFGAFSGDKPEEAREEWDKFLCGKTAADRARKVFSRHQTKGFYAVDTDPSSTYFGCLMLSEQDIPSPSFSLRSSDAASFKRHHMKYVHGDYDLYGLIDVEATENMMRESGGRDKLRPVRENGVLHGVPHTSGPAFKQIQAFINSAIGVDMIQHAGQDNLKHKDDTLYVFYPIGTTYTVRQSADGIRAIYNYVLQQEVFR